MELPTDRHGHADDPLDLAPTHRLELELAPATWAALEWAADLTDGSEVELVTAAVAALLSRYLAGSTLELTIARSATEPARRLALPPGDSALSLLGRLRAALPTAPAERPSARAPVLISTGLVDPALGDARALWLRLERAPARLHLVACGRRWSRAAAERLATHLAAVLAAAGEQLDRVITDLPLEPPEEQRRELSTWNQTARELPGGRALVADAIFAQARRTPTAIAASDGATALTYRQLARASAALARRLREYGAGPEEIVGVCAPRSLETLVSFLAVLRAGAAYLPLDPAYPKPRLELMLRDAKVRLVLVGPEVALPGLDVPTLVMPALPGGDGDGDGDDDGDDDGADSDLDAVRAGGDDAPAPDSLAYIMYTSGSSGAPKGVMISHAALRNTLGWMQEAYPLTCDDVIAHKTSISFTDSIWELAWPLTVGARLVVIDEGRARFPRRLVESLAEHQVTVTQFVPAQMRLFLDEVERSGDAARLPALRLVFNGGEMLPAPLAGEWFHWFPRTCIANAYGMTESAIYGTNFVVRPGAGDPLVLIGRPIANERAYVLDAQGRPCPPLCVGEIYLGGESLSRGYLGRPGLTAERFVPDPLGPPGARMYRTGDLGRWTADGQLVCLGRADRQVKVRGGRVELAEVEVALARHPSVREAVVLARRVGDDHRLVAYYTARGADPGARALHAFLSAGLPAYMVPSAFHLLEHMPLTVNGKVDRPRLECAAPAHD